MGRFKFGPHVIEDVLLDVPAHDRAYEILEAVYDVFDRDTSPVRMFEGMPLP